MAGQLDKYTRGKLLGQGSYGTATLFTTRDSKKVVIKEIDLSKMSPADVKAAEGEVKVLQMLHNSNIVSCIESFRHQGKLCIVMDYCSEGDLQGALKRRQGALLPETLVLDWFMQISLGLKHVHDLSILHRDLKPGNIFMSSGGVLKLGDFGVSRVMDSPAALAKTMIGTPYYISPEITRCKPYNAKSDVWSLGCILYEMLTFRHPFNGRNTTELYRQIEAGVFLPVKGYSAELRNLVALMLQVQPVKRPSMNQILAMPFMQQHIRTCLAQSGIRDVAPPKAPQAAAAVPLGPSRASAAAAAPGLRVPVGLPVSKAPVPAALPAARAYVDVRAALPAGAAPAVDMEKRRLAAQQAALALQNRAVKEAQAQQAQAQARAQEVSKAAQDLKKRDEARHLLEVMEADKKAKLVAQQEAARREAASKLADKAAQNAKGRHERSAQLRALSQKHRSEWNTGGRQEVAHEVFAGPVPARRQPTPEPSPRQEQKVPQHAAHRVSVGMEQPGRRKVAFQEAPPMAVRSAPNSPRGSPGGQTPETTPPGSRGASPSDRPRPASGITQDDRARAYAESKAAAERNKRLVAEQEGLYYPTQPAAPGGAAAAGQNGQNPAMFKAWPKSGSPSVDRSLRKFASNREAGAGRPAEGRTGAEEARVVRIDGSAMAKEVARSDSNSSQDFDEMADMLQRMKTVAEDDCFQSALDAEGDDDDEPEEGEAEQQIRMKALRDELLHLLGPQKLDRVQHLLFHSEAPSKAAEARIQQEVDRILAHVPYTVWGKLKELNAHEQNSKEAPAVAGKH